jgi:hypothetical protein
MGIHGRGILGSHIEGEEIMKLSNLLMIALLAGTLGVFGCSDDDPKTGNGGSGGSGTAGTGGSGTGGSGGNGSIDVGCDEGRCVDAAEATKCEDAIAACILAEPADEAECIAAGNLIYCDESGAGGTGGGGGAGGGGGTGVPPVGSEVCDEGLCTSPGEARDECEELLDLCVEFAPESKWDECVGAALLFACEVAGA